MTERGGDLRDRIDGWLDTLPQPAPQAFVQHAIATGDRIRRRRRSQASLAVAATVAALGIGGALLAGPGTSTPPGPGGATDTPTGPTRTVGGTPRRDATVQYPDGTVTWPGPGGEPTWVQSGVAEQPATAAGLALRDVILAAAPGAVVLGSGPAADPTTDAGIKQAGPVGRTTDLEVRVTDVEGTRLGLLTVRMSRGGLSDQPLAAVMDPCGTWPSGAPGLGLLDGERSAYFENFPERTCSLHRSGGSTFVHWEGRGQEPGGGRTYETRTVFTVRADGTAVAVSSSTRFLPDGSAGSDLLAPRDWGQLEQLASTLPVPAGLSPPAAGRQSTAGSGGSSR